MRHCIIYCCLACWAMFFCAHTATAQVFGPDRKLPALPQADSLAYKRWQLGTPFASMCNGLVESGVWKHNGYIIPEGLAGDENICEKFQTKDGRSDLLLCFIGIDRLTSLVFTCQRGTEKEAQWNSKLKSCRNMPKTNKWLDEEAGVEVTREYVMGKPFAVQYSVRRIGKGL
ncbi:hypothetical protein [Hymenobacter ruber]